MFKAHIDETQHMIKLNFAVLAISDTRDLAQDTSGALLKTLIEDYGHSVQTRDIVIDDKHKIRAKVQKWVVDEDIDVVITTGGTGFSQRDVTPEAIEPLFDKKMDGFAVLFHHYSATQIGTSTLQSRASAGMIGTTLVFCLPGSRGACRDGWDGIIKYQLDSRHKPCNFLEILPKYAQK